jgi:hypothetical protein
VGLDLRNQTVRQIATVSIAGNRMRVMLSNEYGSRPLVIGAAHVALAGSGAAIVAGSDRALGFDGHPSVTIPPGASVISDPVHVFSASEKRRFVGGVKRLRDTATESLKHSPQ